MFKLIKMTIVLGLVVGVIFLGARIHRKSSEIEMELAAKKSEVQKKILGIKKEAIDKTTDLGKIYEKANKKLVESFDRVSLVQTHKKATPEKTSEVNLSLGKKTSRLKYLLIRLMKKTGNLLKKFLEIIPRKKKNLKIWKISDFHSDVSNSQVPVEENDKLSPMELNRVTEIRNLYLKAIETLDFQ